MKTITESLNESLQVAESMLADKKLTPTQRIELELILKNLRLIQNVTGRASAAFNAIVGNTNQKKR